MKKLILSLSIIGILSSCGNTPTKVIPNGYVESHQYGVNGPIKLGEHDEFIRVIGNGDSLFRSYNIDNDGWAKDEIYYTTGGRTSVIEWHVQTGKSGHEEYNIQK